MRMYKISPAGRGGKKVIARQTHVQPECGFAWDSENNRYDFEIVLRNAVTGDKYRIKAAQHQWDDVFEALKKQFETAPG